MLEATPFHRKGGVSEIRVLSSEGGEYGKHLDYFYGAEVCSIEDGDSEDHCARNP
jgi:hypothetical protein